MNRRNFIRGVAGLLIPAPMVVRSESLMRVAPVKIQPWEIPQTFEISILPFGFDDQRFRLLGEMLAESLYETAKRPSFARKFIERERLWQR